MRRSAAPVLAFLLAFPAAIFATEQIDSLGWGVRAAAIIPDYRGADPAWGVGATFIYRHREWPRFALETDFTASVADGQIGSFNFSARTLGGYLAWRSGGRQYLKLRGGVLAEYVEIGGSDEWGSGLSGGIGIGLRRGEQLLELELTGIERAAYMLSLAWYH